ncbi:hypothetical protein DOT_4001 [Desulfosporosinus sp. OT]|nr:hypothetical protein DOT_4001 [Desulfosporosinus sp. OT]
MTGNKENLTCAKPQALAEVFGCTYALAMDGQVSLEPRLE